MSKTRWTDADRALLGERGIDLAEAERQLALLRRPEHHLELDRPARVDDGILRLSDERRRAAIERHAAAASAGRFVKFVPASGAATRMFADLLRFHDGDDTWDPEGDGPHAALRDFVDRVDQHPFRAVLAERFGGEAGLLEKARARDAAALLSVLFEEPLGYHRLPKALLPFHESHEGVRTALEEQLVEAAQTVRDADGVCRIHFTVSPEHETAVHALFQDRRHVVEGAFASRFVVETSTQKPSTDTLALDAGGRPLRDADGRLVLRPGGHGALIDNLADLDAEIAYVKNIDNVQPDGAKGDTLHWKRVLGGLLVEARDAAAGHLSALRDDPADSGNLRAAAGFLRETFHREVADDAGADALIDLLDRPARICGVVENTGEPGGGPFWVRDPAGGLSLQIVETSQIDDADPAQAKLLSAATHFNPVDLVCALRRADGTPYDLSAWVDPEAAIVTAKRVEGRDARVLERPGLWNGAMAGWNTIFVEVPLSTFSPVKTVLDLLRPEHRGTH